MKEPRSASDAYRIPTKADCTMRAIIRQNYDSIFSQVYA